ncbi:MAG TPA: hypothetical protein VG456_14025 [Candidatus Sulfopaludibacter sp.]|nr:hypothetical protein [Candidatus Sulfopaludibacter sp.]
MRSLRQSWDFAAIVLIVMVSMPSVWLSSRALAFVPHPGFIDDNWHLDGAFKASRGIWIGRDVAFTHGPVFQWLSSLPARCMGVSMGSIYPTWNTVPLWCAALFLFLTLRLLLGGQPPWKRFVLLLLLCIFWEPSLRTAFSVLAFAVFLRGWLGVTAKRVRGSAFGFAAAVMCALGFLLAADQGIYTLASLLITLAATVIENRRAPEALKKLLPALVTLAAGCAILVLAVNTLLATPLDFGFWRNSFSQISAYRWATAFRMSPEGTLYLFGTLAAGVGLFALRAILELGPGFLRRPAFLLGGFIFGLAEMESGLVRADTGHIVSACFPMIFLLAVILFSFESPNVSLAGMSAALLASAFFGQAAFGPSSLTRIYRALRYPLTACPAGTTEFDRTCYPQQFSEMLNTAATYLRQRSGPAGAIAVFPYQTRFGIASGRNVAGGLMQAYTASGAGLARLEIAGLERAPVPAGVYLPDPDLSQFGGGDLARWRDLDLSLPVDGVANFTRTPEVWFWLLRHYRVEQQLSQGVFGLQRDDSRSSRISMGEQPLGLTPQTFPISDRNSATELGTAIWPVDADVLRLRLTVHYGALWRIRKPERMQLEITRADGSHVLQWFILPPNVSSEVWFYPWSPPDLVHYFAADEMAWRPGPRPAITRLRLIATPLDWVSQTPEAITLDSADAIALHLRP